MRVRAPAFAFAALVPFFCAASEDSTSTGTPRGDAAAASQCVAALASASHINATALFAGSIACAQARRKEDTNFLMIVGQLRATTDMSIFQPLDDENAMRAGQLYAQLFYQFGGLGFDEVYRTPASVDELERRIRNTDLSFTSGYDPGWAYRPSSKTDLYAQVLSNGREHRIWQMRNMALKLQNDAYYEAYRAEEELRRRVRVFQAGTPEYEEEARLTARMDAAAKNIPELPEPQSTLPYDRLSEQDPELAKRQLASGFNGPASSNTYVFHSSDEVRHSWLAKALSREDLDKLILRTDFSKQVLIAYSFGERENAAGPILLSELGYHRAGQGYSISTVIGVVPESCGVRFAKSYPFVVGLTDAVPDAQVNGTGTSNFPAPCGPIATGNPTAD